MAWLRSAVILGAGIGSRLRAVIQDRPKGFLKFGEKAIVEESITKLIQCGIQSVVIVAGYRREYYEELAQRFPFVSIVINPEYESTGSMYSLYCARDVIKRDFILVEADVVYEMRGLLALQNSALENSILLSGKTGSGDEVYVGVNDSRVVKLSKDRSQIENLGGELVGLSRISLSLFKNMCLNSERALSRKSTYHYEDALTDSSSQSEIGYDAIDDLVWIEVDDPAHFVKASGELYPLIIQRDQHLKLNRSVDRKILLNPGPATTSDSVKLSMVVEDICPRESEFGDLVERVRTDLVRIAHGEQTHEAVLFASSGTGAVEACLSSVIPPSKKVLIINNGAYGKRMQEICDGFGIGHVDYNISWGDPVDSDILLSLIRSHGLELSHVACIHHETTIGILNPLDVISSIAHTHGLELIVDAMSSFAGIPIDLRETEIEYLISSSNKCIQGMAGISFAICRQSALEATKHHPLRNYYFNLFRNYQFFSLQKQMQFTPPVQVFYALRQAINEYFLEGEDARHQRYEAMYTVLCDGLRKLDFQFLVDVQHHAKILTAIIEPSDPRYNFDEMHDYLFANDFTIYPGKGAKQNTFRLATMGALNTHDIERFLTCLKEYIVLKKISLSPSAVKSGALD